MLKFKTDHMIGLGITDENIRRLKHGNPILVKGAEMGLDHDILIIHGRTEMELMKQMNEADLIGKGTKINRSTDRS